MKPFVVSPDVTFPANAATSTFALLGTRGSGKTYAAGKLVETFLAQNVQVVIVDPVGTWWALRLAADGKRPGFEIPVFGGIHGDVPLEATAGELVAQLVVERRMSCVLDVSDFTDGQQHRFVTDLAREIFRLKKRNPSPLHLVFEEGHEFFPQFVDAAAAPMVGATKRLWKVGRNYGIGGTIVSQRAAEINKGALNLTDRIVTGQLRAPEDIKRIDGWANSNGVSDAMVIELPRLPKGTLIVWEETGAVRTVFNKKTTFDASKTPDGSEVKASKLAPIDLEAVRLAMASTLSEAKTNDPKVLKSRIVELERELAKKPVPQAPKTIAQPIDRRDEIARLEKLEAWVGKQYQDFSDQLTAWKTAQNALTTEIIKLRRNVQPVPALPSNGVDTGRLRHRIETPVNSDERLPDSTQRMLAALRQGEAMGLTAMPFRNVAVIAGVAPNSGTTSNRKGLLVSRGLITVLGKGKHGEVQLTDAGRVYPIDVAMPPRDPEELLAFWKREIGTEKIGAILETVVQQGPISNEALAAAVGMENSGTFSNYKGALIGRGLIEKVNGAYVPTSVFRHS